MILWVILVDEYGKGGDGWMDSDGQMRYAEDDETVVKRDHCHFDEMLDDGRDVAEEMM